MKNEADFFTNQTDNHGKIYRNAAGEPVPRTSTILRHCSSPDDWAGMIDFASNIGKDWPGQLDRWADVGTEVHLIAEHALRRVMRDKVPPVPGPDALLWQNETFKKCVAWILKRPDAERIAESRGYLFGVYSLALWHEVRSKKVNDPGGVYGDEKFVTMGGVSFALWLADALDQRDLAPLFLEKVSVSERWQYGCTSDFVGNIDLVKSACILDFKTGKPKNKDYIQLAANAVAFGEQHGFTVAQAGCVYLKKSWGKNDTWPELGPAYSTTLWNREQMVNGWKQFKHGLQLHSLRTGTETAA